VINVVRHPGLEAERRDPAYCPSAVQECFVDSTDFRDMGMSRDESAIGQEKTELECRMIPEGRQEE